ncbi:uncharacterized protein CDAR_71891 [Caerostris darwini]|uniref:Uncharacterized protein n=1 Tax=Caerostris darwini TaxID=1538125 RepID=A0AAV4TJA3_9ARAC|nr:uncharacterized protein CDAR_71891 [Caerostris darwini]
MPHTTSSEVVSPSLGAISTVDVWDDPRSLRTFSTFHQSNDKNNAAFTETSFFPSPKLDATRDSPQNGNVDEVKTNGINHWNKKSENGNGSFNGPSDSILKSNLSVAFNKQKTSPKIGKLVKPVTPPPILNQKLKVEPSSCNSSFDSTQDQNTASPQNHSLNNMVEKTLARQPSPLSNFLQSTLEETNENGLHPPKENGANHHDDDNDVVSIHLGLTDKRFGFSVVGGCDEGFVPRIEHITTGNLVIPEDHFSTPIKRMLVIKTSMKFIEKFTMHNNDVNISESYKN